MRKFYYLLVVFFLWSCNDSITENIGEQQTNPPEFNYEFGGDVNRNFYGQVIDRSGNPISGALVSAGSSSTQTTAEGFFILKDVTVKENFAHLKVTKSGFVDASKVLIPTSGDHRVNVMMIPATTTSTITTGSTNTVSLPDGTSVKFDGSFKDASGNAYSGNVNVAVFNLATSDAYFNETMPGNLLASNSSGEAQMLESYGMMHVQLTGDAGQDLQIADGHTAQITYPIDATQTSIAPATIPLWGFNEDMGIWVEEGVATKVGNNYVGNVSHFSWWNCDVPNDYAHLSVTVTDSAGMPASGIVVGLKTASMTYEVSGYTNGNGVVSGIVIANQALEMNIYDFCGNIIYSGNIGPFTTNSTNNLSQSVSGMVQISTIMGTLVDCSGNNVTDGFVILNQGSNSLFWNAQYVTNGVFSFTTPLCTNNFVLNGYDYGNSFITGDINFTATTPTTNLGTIPVCNAATEYISYSLDGQPALMDIGPFDSRTDATPTTQQLAFIKTDNPVFVVGEFYFNFNSYLNSFVTGSTVNSNYNFSFSGDSNFSTVVDSYDTVFNFNYVGAVGDYIDFTFNGTYQDSVGVSHTISGTGHVIRDN